MLPAPSQGIVGIVCKKGSRFESTLDRIDHKQTHLCGAIERAFLNELEAGCSSPVGAHAKIDGSVLSFKGAVLSVDGAERLDIEKTISLEEAGAFLGKEWAVALKKEGADKLLEQSGNE